MSLLRRTQEILVEDVSKVSTALLNLKLLAAKLGSQDLEDWVRYETEGYPPNVDVPDYRIIDVNYVGTFQDSVRIIKNAPIPSVIIEDVAGKKWNRKSVKEGLSSIADLIERAKGEGGLSISGSNLILLLQDRVYEGMACNSIHGQISPAALVGIQTAVVSRVIDLTVQIEKKYPESADISLADPKPDEIAPASVSSISNSVIYGSVNQVGQAGASNTANINVRKGDLDDLREAFREIGLTANEANELSSVVASERSDGVDQPMGKAATQWFANRLKMGKGVFKDTSLAVLAGQLSDAISRYHGL